MVDDRMHLVVLLIVPFLWHMDHRLRQSVTTGSKYLAEMPAIFCMVLAVDSYVCKQTSHTCGHFLCHDHSTF